MRIGIFEVEPWERESFEALQEEHEIRFSGERLTADNADEFADAEIVSTFIYSDLSEAVLRKLEKLELVATRSTGIDHVDAEFCKQQGITVANVPTYGDSTVAEHVFALLLAVGRHIVEAANRTSRGDFSLKGLRGFDLRGTTLGLIGTGSIGAQVIPSRRASAWR
jgi:D-lactate dehydrogenase